MKPTKHATTNYRMILPFLSAVDREDGHVRFTSGGYMPLVIENLCYTFRGAPVYSITHYGEQNGDAMRDPDMELAINREAGTVEPLTFRNDYMGMYQEVYKTGADGRLLYSPRLRTSLDEFLWQWLKNIAEQGFTPEERETA